MTIEIRKAGACRVEKREGEQRSKIVGYASVFDAEYRNDFWGMIEVIRAGAFTRTLKEKADVRALIDHDPSKILARTKSGTLKLREDNIGLLSEIDPADTSFAQDLVRSLERGDIDGMSFGFTVQDEQWGKRDGMILREITDVNLFDVSVVTFPAYKETSVTLRELRADGTAEPLEEIVKRGKRALGPDWRSELQEKYLALLAADL